MLYKLPVKLLLPIVIPDELPNAMPPASFEINWFPVISEDVVDDSKAADPSWT